MTLINRTDNRNWMKHISWTQIVVFRNLWCKIVAIVHFYCMLSNNCPGTSVLGLSWTLFVAHAYVILGNSSFLWMALFDRRHWKRYDKLMKGAKSQKTHSSFIINVHSTYTLIFIILILIFTHVNIWNNVIQVEQWNKL